MTNKAISGFKVTEADIGAVNGKKVLPDRTARAAMGHSEPLFADRKGEIGQVVCVFGGQMVSRPTTGYSGIRIEISDFYFPNCS